MSNALKFRKTFESVNKNVLLWFPGHMNKGVKQMQQKLKNVDCVIEVHDARIPFSGRNQLLQHTLLGVKPHILVLNKCDLTYMTKEDKVKEIIQREQHISEVLFTDCRTVNGDGVGEIVPTVVKTMEGVNRYNRSDNAELCLMVMGVPNVGKSSLINALRSRYTKRGKATAVGAVAGITTSVLTRIQVCYHPSIYLMDTPGILEPTVRDVEAAYRLALCASMQDHLVGVVNIADYLLYWLNKHENFSYVKHFNLEEPCDKAMEVMVKIATQENLYNRVKDLNTGQWKMVPNFNRAAELFVKAFRTGCFGPAMLDTNYLRQHNS